MNECQARKCIAAMDCFGLRRHAEVHGEARRHVPRTRRKPARPGHSRADDEGVIYIRISITQQSYYLSLILYQDLLVRCIAMLFRCSWPLICLVIKPLRLSMNT